MKKIISIVISCLLIMLVMLSVSVAYAQDVEDAIPAEETIPLFAGSLEEENVPETCYPQIDNV